MKKILFFACIMLISMVSLSNAVEWVDDFHVNFDTQGIEVAVDKALENGIDPYNIITEGLYVGSNPQHIIKALYCSGADGDDIKDGTMNHGISDLILIAGFDQSVAECGDVVADYQAYTPVNTSFAGMPRPISDNNRTYASRSTF